MTTSINAAKVGADNPSTTGPPVSLESTVLETGAGALQDFAPLKSVCAHLNAYHVYADEPSRSVETNHYCAHLTDDVRQCLLYDSAEKNARLIGIEYMITPRVYATLDSTERRLWHSHVFEVKSGMLVMPLGATARHVPGAQTAWDAAETREMKQVIELYGKVYHLWQTDRGDKLPLGEPKLMTSFTAVEQMGGEAKFAEMVSERDGKFGTDWKKKRDLRKDIEEPQLHEDADATWKGSGGPSGKAGAGAADEYRFLQSTTDGGQSGGAGAADEYKFLQSTAGGDGS